MEEGKLHSQLLDRFSLSVEMSFTNDIAQQLQVVEQPDVLGLTFDGFMTVYSKQGVKIHRAILANHRDLPPATIRGLTLLSAARILAPNRSQPPSLPRSAC